MDAPAPALAEGELLTTAEMARLALSDEERESFREAIGQMLEGLFHRDARNFDWQMIEPLSDETRGYARWVFSFDGAMVQTEGKRIVMEGVGLFELRAGLISRYEDFAKTGEVLLRLGFPPENLYRVLSGKVADADKRDEVRAHLDR